MFAKPNPGLEPRTYWLQISCATNCASPAYIKRLRRESNPRLPGDNRIYSPLYYRAIIPPIGIEPIWPLKTMDLRSARSP